MSDDALHPLAADYLRRLRRAGGRLAPDRLAELTTEIEGHLREAIPADATDDEALEVLERLGPPGDIVEAEEPSDPPATDRRSWREWGAVILLPLGGFVIGVGWLLGLVLLWTSRLWTTRDKVIGTLIVPGGIASVLIALVLEGSKRRCTTTTMRDPSTGALIAAPTTHCVPSAGPGAATTALHIAVVAFLVVGPIVSAVYLARRARGDRTPIAVARP
jgi:hypothetical protein